MQSATYTGTEVGGVNGRQMPGKVEQPREAQGTLCVLTLEFNGGNPTGGDRTSSYV